MTSRTTAQTVVPESSAIRRRPSQSSSATRTERCLSVEATRIALDCLTLAVKARRTAVLRRANECSSSTLVLSSPCHVHTVLVGDGYQSLHDRRHGYPCRLLHVSREIVVAGCHVYNLSGWRHAAVRALGYMAGILGIVGPVELSDWPCGLKLGGSLYRPLDLASAEAGKPKTLHVRLFPSVRARTRFEAPASSRRHLPGQRANGLGAVLELLLRSISLVRGATLRAHVAVGTESEHNRRRMGAAERLRA